MATKKKTNTKKSPAKKTATKKVVKKASAGNSKMDMAIKIYEEEKKKKGFSRKGCILRFVTEAGLTKAGASTYYANIKTKH
jgi:hypothetical protein